jgi:antitoxin (DNA-binding transcriptional repressor) of toxin-antitoxin stability system
MLMALRRRFNIVREEQMPTASVTDVARDLTAYVARVEHGGERYTLVREGKVVAELSPVPAGVRIEDLPSLFASLPRLSPNEAEVFGHDIEAARR